MENKLIIPQGEFNRIEADALAWAENQHGHDDVNKDYLEGALHEAMIAQKKIVDLEKELSALKAQQGGVMEDESLTRAAERIADKLMVIVKKQLGIADESPNAYQELKDLLDITVDEFRKARQQLKEKGDKMAAAAEDVMSHVPSGYATRGFKELREALNAWNGNGQKKEGEDWIDVNDQLPEEGGRYWCYMRDITDLGTSYFQWNCAYNEKEKRFSDSTLFNGEQVTHWRKLPEPPKQQKEK